MKSLATSLLILVSPLMSSCSEVSGGPFEGIVIEAGTGRPIEGAEVVVKWLATMSGVNGTWYPCYHVEIATTGKDGKFFVPKWIASADSPEGKRFLKNLNAIQISSLDKPIETQAYLPGHLSHQQAWSKQATATVQVQTLQIEKTARVKQLFQLSEAMSDCTDGRRLVPLRKRIYEEARSIASTPEDIRFADGILIGIEMSEFGQEEALKRSQERNGLSAKPEDAAK